MRSIAPKAILATALLATSWLAATPARADDSDGEGTEQMVPGVARSGMPGMRATGAEMQRPGHDNPEMKLYELAPRTAAAPVAEATTPAVPDQPEATQVAALPDVERLLQRAERDLQAHRARNADTDLEQAETALLNAQAAGQAVPPQALAPVMQARDALRHGDTAAATRATENAHHAVAG